MKLLLFYFISLVAHFTSCIEMEIGKEYIQNKPNQYKCQTKSMTVYKMIYFKILNGYFHNEPAGCTIQYYDTKVIYMCPTNEIEGTVDCNLSQNCIISCFSEYREDIKLDSNIEYYEEIIILDKFKKFSISSNAKNDTDNRGYIINIEPLNCYIDIFFNNTQMENQQRSQIYISAEDTLFDNETFYFGIKINHFQSKDKRNDDYCRMLISGYPINAKGEGKLIIHDFITRSTIFNQYMSSIVFIFNDSYLKAPSFLSFIKEDNHKIHVDLLLNRGKIVRKDIYKSTDIIFTDRIFFDNKTATIRIVNDGTSSTEFKSLMRINRDTRYKPIERNIYYTFQFSYYFIYEFTSPVYDKEEGGIFINLKQGGAKIEAFLNKGDTLESLEEARINPSLYKFTKFMTRGCSRGFLCNIYIKLTKKDLDFELKPDSAFVLSIMVYVNNNEDYIASTNEYVKGYNVYSNVTYYTITIKEDTNRIVISKDSLFTTMIISEEVRPTLNNYQWKINHNENYLLINSDDLNKTSLKGTTFKIGMKETISNFQYDKTYYKFIIVPQYKNSEIIRLLTNDVKEQCIINSSSNACYYLIDITDYTKYKDIIIYTLGKKGSIKHCGIWIDVSKYNIYDYQTDLSDIIHNTTCDIESNEMLTISRDIMMNLENTYLLVKVTSIYPQIIDTYITYYTDVTSIRISNEGEQLMCGQKDKNLTLIFYNLSSHRNILSFYPINEEFIIYGQYEYSVTNYLHYWMEIDEQHSNLKIKAKEKGKNFCYIGQLIEGGFDSFMLMEGKNQIEDIKLSKSFYYFTFYYKINKEKRNSQIVISLTSPGPSVDTFESYIVSEDIMKIAIGDYYYDLSKENRILHMHKETKNTFIMNTNSHYDGKDFIVFRFKTVKNTNISSIIAYCYSYISSIEEGTFYYSQLYSNDDVQILTIENHNTSNFIYAITLSLEPNNENEKLKFSIDYYKETPSMNEENNITITEKDINGKHYIFAEVTDNITPLMITFTRNGTTPSVIKYMIKYKTIKEQSEIKEIEYQRTFTSFGYGSVFTIGMNEIFNDTSMIKYSKYHLFVYHTKDVTLQSVDTIYWNNPTYRIGYNSFEGKNKGEEFKVSLKITDIDYNVYLAIVVEYEMNDSNQKEYLALSPMIPEVTNPNLVNGIINSTNYGKIDNSNVFAYVLERKSTDKYLSIEFALAPTRQNKVYISPSIEKYKQLVTYKNESDYEIVFNKINNGKGQLVYKINNTDEKIILMFSSSSSLPDILDYYFTFDFSTKQKNPFSYGSDSFIECSKGVDLLNITFNKISSSTIKSLRYLFKIFDKNNFEDINNSLKSAYPNSTLSIFEGIIDVNQTNKSINKIIQFDKTLLDRTPNKYYIQIIAEAVLFPEKTIYMFYGRKVINQLKLKYELRNPVEDHLLNIQRGLYTMLRLAKTQSSHSYYTLEFAPEIHYSQRMNNDFTISYETYTDFPKYQNDTTVKLIKNKTISGKQIIVIQPDNKDEDIIISFLYNDTDNNDNNINVYFHYYTSDKEIPDKDFIIDSYPPNEFATHQIGRKLTFSFFKPKIYYSKLDMTLIFYSTNEINNFSPLNSICLNNSVLLFKQEEIKYKTITEESKLKYEVEFLLPNDYFGRMYTVLVIKIGFYHENQLIHFHYGFHDDGGKQYYDKYKVKPELIYNKEVISLNKPLTYRLVKTKKENEYFEIEIAEKTKSEKYQFDFSIEKYNGDPTGVNDTWIKQRETNENNIRKILLYSPENNVIDYYITFSYTSQNNITNEEEHSFLFLFKYVNIDKAINRPSIDDIQLGKYLYASYLLNTITIQFNQLSDNSYYNFSPYNYLIYIYRKDQVKNKEEINTIYIDEEPNFTAKRRLESKMISVQFNSDNKDLYITLIANCTIGQGEPLLTNYGVVELNSNNYIIILPICAGFVLIVGIVIGIVCYCRKRRHNKNIIEKDKYHNLQTFSVND